MTQPAYPAARTAAARVYQHFQSSRGEAAGVGDAVAPDARTIESMIDAAFWASLRREETYTPRVSLAFATPAQLPGSLRLERAVALEPGRLTRLAPAVETPGIHLGVWLNNGQLEIWGATRTLPVGCFVLEVLAPGLLVIKHSRSDEAGKFVNVAVLQGDEVKIVDQRAGRTGDCPGLITSLLELESPPAQAGPANLLIQVAVAMRGHGRGGALLVTPSANPEAWRESILHPVMYAVAPNFTALSVATGAHGGHTLPGQERLARLVEGVAGLTAVDGATVMTDRYELLAFGAKIMRRRGHQQVGEVMLTEPTEDNVPLLVEPSQLGGTRHLSAAQFAHDQRDAMALVASQDGRFTVFAWSACEERVHAHRIDALLL